jgi:hypothetical protein
MLWTVFRSSMLGFGGQRNRKTGLRNHCKRKRVPAKEVDVIEEKRRKSCHIFRFQGRGERRVPSHPMLDAVR